MCPLVVSQVAGSKPLSNKFARPFIAVRTRVPQAFWPTGLSPALQRRANSCPLTQVVHRPHIPFFRHSLSWAPLRANCCARQLYGFRFPGSSLEDLGSLPECSRSLWEQRPLASGCPKKMGQEKGEKFSCIYMLSGIGSG